MSNQLRQPGVGQQDTEQLDRVEEYKFEPIKGYPMLHWHGKRPFTSTQYYPAQHKETYGPEVQGWRNKIYWGDNLQVMSHLLKEFRGKVKLVYIDPPFDSKADYKLIVRARGQTATNDQSAFEEKQYTDIWTNDEYLQFMYQRIILLRELLADDGSVYVHCDWHKSHYLRLMLDEIFGSDYFRNEIIWKRKGGSSNPSNQFDIATDTILLYVKSKSAEFNAVYSRDTLEAKEYIEERFTNYDDNGRRYMKSPIVSPNYRENLIYEYKGYSPPPNGWSISKELMERWDREGKLYFPERGERIYRKIYLDEYPGQPVSNLWADIFVINPMAKERVGYPTQKPEALLARIIKISSKPGDIVFDCFMGSGTTQAVAMKLGRRFIGADINLGAVQITTKRLVTVSKVLSTTQTIPADNLRLNFDENDEGVVPSEATTLYTGFDVYNVNHYDVFRNPVEAKDLLLQALEVNRLQAGNIFDGEKDGRLVKVLPVNRIATRQDLNELITGFDYRAFDRRRAENPNKPVEKVMLVCMGHEPGLAAHLKQEVSPYVLDVEVVDILRDKQEIQFKRDSQARITIQGGYLVIERFYPMNLLAKLSVQAETVGDWRELVESVMIDWNYDGAVLQPAVVDIPPENRMVAGRYAIPEDAGTIRVKITDLLSESLEQEVRYG
ncbi:MAG TPA: site-specific DNA-methyltransferase [Herpetosiphonaceae bacterium]